MLDTAEFPVAIVYINVYILYNYIIMMDILTYYRDLGTHIYTMTEHHQISADITINSLWANPNSAASRTGPHGPDTHSRPVGEAWTENSQD